MINLKTLPLCLTALVMTSFFAHADTDGQLVTPEEFETLSQNKTLYFYRYGKIYGAEQFFKGRQSTWKFANGECDRGIWYPKGDQICFDYEANPGEQCWHFIKNGDDFAARYIGADPIDDLLLKAIDRSELICDYPDLNS